MFWVVLVVVCVKLFVCGLCVSWFILGCICFVSFSFLLVSAGLRSLRVDVWDSSVVLSFSLFVISLFFS